MADRPNIVFVFCDQLRQAAVGCYGQDPVVTPNLDRFAAESRVLTHCTTTQPVCTPYRAMLFTGRYPFATGMHANCNSNSPVHLSDDERCLTDVLADGGYSMGYLGKLHLHRPTETDVEYGEGPRGNGVVWDAFTPPGPGRHGVQFWYSYGCCDKHLDPHYWTGNTGPEQRVDPHEWSVRHETDVAIEFLRNTGGRYRDTDRPFMLMVSHNPPHPPFDQVPDEYLEPFRDMSFEQLLNRPNVQVPAEQRERARMDAAQYFAAIHGIDQQFGRLLATLDELSLSDETIVIFTADHGELMHSHGLMQKNWWYDESLLVPYLIRWPGRIKPGRDDLLLSAVDHLPTMLGLAGLADQVPAQVQGADRSSVLLSQGGERPDSAFYLWPDARLGARDNPISTARGVRTHRHLYVVARDDDGNEQRMLYDCEADPYQMNDIAGQQGEVVNRLHEELERWLRRTDDSFEMKT